VVQHDPRKWLEFQKRYRSELKQHPEASDPIVRAAQQGTVTLVYGARDPKRNSAAVLCDYLKKKLTAKQSQGRKSAA